MADTFRQTDGTSLPPSDAGTEFERSIARGGDAESDAPMGLREKINDDIGSTPGARDINTKEFECKLKVPPSSEVRANPVWK